MPISGLPGLRLPNPDKHAYLDFMPDTEVPVIRQPFREGDLLPYWSLNPPINDHHLYKISDDPDENENRVGEPLENTMQDLLRAALAELQAPAEQIARLGL